MEYCEFLFGEKYEIHFKPFFTNKKAGLLKSGLKHSVIYRKKTF
ncbi:hypothetical protein LEP1GSC034_2349 [Leptospira interrogans str. 2003000735]|uniref:Uncharacterized protein n=5 Tax=Leptospira interrogans TaxID=173 RepID=A0A0E2D0U2_LEPIR|nr:hypothetical protein LEP1GSC007_4216 [Leptospira interrogans serovar Bulgarica str. Mallika]EKN87294.1 hypothetical protein LEP1GSC027_3218 [Leptospira interrogans str. 2002000624]EKO06196.1 hypothetical protein LEP1GSC077_2528 [Leptospira interrogans str. C10069]EKO87752.1 hypothetical protein LEP1GSC009_3176 [Leptospira interrogans serovar Grippotyphosa str. Andaman]EKP86669.1 hypothetical protein LEP1GSC020_2706 [Leptospira interrogans serovar Grippotyphosa str. 2006006986]EKQ38451.1 hyp